MNVVGEKIRFDSNSPALGQITSQEIDNGVLWLEIDNNYQQRACEFDYIIDLTNADHYMRPKSNRRNGE